MSRSKRSDPKPYKRPNGVYYVDVYDKNGKRKQKSTNQREYAAAVMRARQIRNDELVRPTLGSKKEKGLTLEGAIGALIAQGIRDKKKPSTVRDYSFKGTRLVDYFGQARAITAFSQKIMEKYRADRLQMPQRHPWGDLKHGADGEVKLPSEHTIQKECRLLIQVAMLADVPEKEATGWMPKLYRDKKTNYYTPRERWLPIDQCIALVDHMSVGHNADVCRRDHVAAYINMGLRFEELYKIRVKDVHLDEGWVWVDGTKTDSAHRVVWLSDNMKDIFKRRVARLRHGDQVFESWGSPLAHLQRAAKRAGIPLREDGETINFITLRRTFCSHMATGGTPLAHCAKLMGHASTEMVEKVYARLAPESLQSAIQNAPNIAVRGAPVAVIGGAKKKTARKAAKRTRKAS